MGRPRNKITKGATFGRWVVKAEKVEGGVVYYGCECSCPTHTRRWIRAGSLRGGGSLSCGCLRDERSRAVQTTHGMSKHPAYGTWSDMMSRCYNPNVPRYRDYGQRGIRVCKKWHDPRPFIAWLLENGWSSERDEVDRRNNGGAYSPANCILNTGSGNCRNKRNNRIVRYRGRDWVFIDLWEAHGVTNYSTARARLRLGWGIEALLKTPAGSQGNRYITQPGVYIHAGSRHARSGSRYVSTDPLKEGKGRRMSKPAVPPSFRLGAHTRTREQAELRRLLYRHPDAEVRLVPPPYERSNPLELHSVHYEPESNRIIQVLC